MENCFICLESNSVINCREAIYSIQNEKYYFSCECKIYTHVNCMQIWLEHTQKCPICRCKLPFYQGKTLVKKFCKAFVKSCVVVFLFIIYISEAVKKEIRQDDFDITFCRYINNTTVKSI